MQRDPLNLIEPKLKELFKLLKKYENERIKSQTNLSSISNTHDTMRNNESKMTDHYKKKLSGFYQGAINDANAEITSLKKAIKAINEIHDLQFEKELSSEKREGLKVSTGRDTLMNKLSKNGMNLPLWIGRKNEPPPPLCGAIPAEPNYIAKVGDMVAALVNVSGNDDVWILAEVTRYNNSTNEYKVDDIDEAEEAKYTLSRNIVIPLPLMRANPETDSEALFPKDTVVLALYPRTTCFYHAKVQEPPSKSYEDYKLLFVDGSYNYGYSPPLPVAQRYVINCNDVKKK